MNAEILAMNEPLNQTGKYVMRCVKLSDYLKNKQTQMKRKGKASQNVGIKPHIAVLIRIKSAQALSKVEKHRLMSDAK